MTVVVPLDIPLAVLSVQCERMIVFQFIQRQVERYEDLTKEI